MAEISLRAEEIFHIGNFAITNSLLLSSITLIFLSSIALALRRNLAMSPGGIQNAMEIFVDGALDFTSSVLGGSRAKAEKYFPLITTIFVFILFSNWLGLLPGIGSIVVNTHEGQFPLLRSPASDLNFTLALAIISVVATNLIGVGALGLLKHGKKFLNFKNPIAFFVGILEIISEFAKIVSFSFRLFGNVFAGEVLLVIIAFLVPYLIPLPFMFLEIFVGFIQAFIFAMLTLVFIASATTEEQAH
ncbi:MAG: F0F1 ATP synthase subunit A [bacterium]|nr:F0F1 ATP synthase subunit A [bacterium]